MEKDRHLVAEGVKGSWVLWGLMVLGFMGALLARAPWDFAHGVMWSVLGLLMLFSPGLVRTPRLIVGAGVVALAWGLLVFLPAGEFPVWRQNLESLGLDTGDLAVIQAEQAIEVWAGFVVMLGVLLLVAGRRIELVGAERLGLFFLLLAAGYALLSRQYAGVLQQGYSEGHFGFFPNRNHSSMLMATAVMVGLGVIAWEGQKRCWWKIVVAGIAMLICAWAALAWTVSRSGLLLLIVGVPGFLLLVGSRGMGRNAKWAIGLMVLLGVGGFVFSDTDLKRRLVEASWNNHGVVDFRVLIWRDALTMIADSPWRGVGADQFGAVFPQYRELASVHNEADTVHPESDWLWVAAEMGVPAMLLLIGVVSGCFWMSWRSLKDGKGRALRAGFLMGALMLPIHGLFEVPGHRLPLLMIALVLWGLSLGPHLGSGFLKAELSRSQARHWALRAFGLLIIGAGAYLLSWESMGLRAPVMVRDQHLREEVERRLALDKALAAEASQAGLEYLPDESDDPIVGAFGLIEETLEVVPMKRSLWHLRGQLSALYDTRVPLLERSFVIERALNPFWVEGPMRQGEVAEGFQKNLAMDAWSEAEERAIRLETLDPETRWSAEEVRARRDRSYKRAGWDQ